MRPISAVVATKDRPESLARMLQSLRDLGSVPCELILIDASTDPTPNQLLARQWESQLKGQSVVGWHRADTVGAAAQRNQGVALATQQLIWFLDDDIILQTECGEALATAFDANRKLGGANAMIVNQQYHSPGASSRRLFSTLNGRKEKSYAGKIIGPAVNLLPEDRDDLPAVVPVEWLNTTCTMYRREALPSPVFDEFFVGYSLMEDVVLSQRVAARGWQLANVRGARVFHDSQAGREKSDPGLMSAMELVNRYYTMTNVLQRRRWTDHLKLGLYELFQIAATARQKPRTLPAMLRGKIAGISQILKSR